MADERKYPGEGERGGAWKLALVLIFFGVIVYLWGESVSTEPGGRHRFTYTEFTGQLEAGNIRSVTIEGEEIRGELKSPLLALPAGGREAVTTSAFRAYLPPFQGPGILDELRTRGVVVDVEPASGYDFWQVVFLVLPWVLIIGVWIFIMRRAQQGQGGQGGLFNFGMSKAKLFNARKPGVTFSGVAGLENAKMELQETVAFLKNPGRFTAIGAKVPKGILLVGPPGTGKTLLARATAGEAGVPFFSISASEFIEMFVGVGASRVRDMFKRARDTRPSIIFIDEIDSVGRTRGAGLGGGHDEREQTLNQLLSEMDGFEAHEEIIVIAATNRPDVLDPALLRPGRFDRHILIDRPGWKDRLAILEVHTRNKRLDPGVDLEKVSKGTPGMTGADLENLANEAALEAVKKGRDTIDTGDFEEALDKVVMGTKREETFSEEERRITAVHESGHALVSWSLPHTDPIHKVSIIPRGMSLGVTQFVPEEDRHYYPKSYLMNRLAVALAGRAAEKLVFDDVSSGANDDLKNATALAEKMVAQWGMSDRVGPLNFGRGEEHPFLGRDISAPKRYSEDMAWLMDQEIRGLLVEAEERADEIIARERAALESLASALVANESLDSGEVDAIIRASRGGKEGLRRASN